MLHSVFVSDDVLFFLIYLNSLLILTIKNFVTGVNKGYNYFRWKTSVLKHIREESTDPQAENVHF